MLVEYVISSNIAAVGYQNGVLRLCFHSGSVYDYYDVPKEVYLGLMTAASKGRYHHAMIRNQYLYRRIA